MRKARWAALAGLVLAACTSPIYEPPELGRRISLVSSAVSSVPVLSIPAAVRQRESFEARFSTYVGCSRAVGVDVVFGGRGGHRAVLEPWEERPATLGCTLQQSSRYDHRVALRFDRPGPAQVVLRGAQLRGNDTDEQEIVTFTHTIQVLPL